MITVNDVSLNFSGQTLFKHVDLKFVPGNCYGIIGANGAGKTTFLRILSGDLEPTTGEVVISKDDRMSVLKQDHFQYDAYTVLDTVILGNQHLYDVMKEKDALYEKEDFSDADGVRASELEAEFAEMGGWEAESDVSRLIQGLGLSNDILYSEMSTLTAKEKVKVLLAQALFGKPDIILLDEPTNHLDIQSREWIEEAVEEYEGNLLFVSHDRYFIDRFASRIWLLENGQITDFRGTYQEFQAARARGAAGQAASDAVPAPTKAAEPERKKEKPKRPGGTKNLEKEVTAAERAVAKAEEAMDALSLQIEEASADYLKLQELYEQREALEAELQGLYDRWETLSAQLEEARG